MARSYKQFYQAQRNYHREYNKKTYIVVGVTFNRNSKEEMEAYDWVDSRGRSKGSYIRRLILDDMKKKNQEEKENK